MTAPDRALDALLDGAVAAARAAGSHALANGARRREAVAQFAHDVKLKLDEECQQIVQREITARFPGHAIVGEEDATVGGRAGAEVEWVVDPIDGTVNFSHGLPFWCCSVAAMKNGETVAGAVYAPALGVCYTARLGGGAFCNGEPIRVSAVSDLAGAMILTGLDKSPDGDLPPFALFEATSNSVQKARILGSAALDICRVAHGQADGYFETGIYIWDIAAARLIATEAGGKAEILQRLERGRLRFLATNGGIHRAYRTVLTDLIGPAGR
jgi:myo-inositol-1(or 4)-monophosphatase